MLVTDMKYNRHICQDSRDYVFTLLAKEKRGIGEGSSYYIGNNYRPFDPEIDTFFVYRPRDLAAYSWIMNRQRSGPGSEFSQLWKVTHLALSIDCYKTADEEQEEMDGEYPGVEVLAYISDLNEFLQVFQVGADQEAAKPALVDVSLVFGETWDEVLAENKSTTTTDIEVYDVPDVRLENWIPHSSPADDDDDNIDKDSHYSPTEVDALLERLRRHLTEACLETLLHPRYFWRDFPVTMEVQKDPDGNERWRLVFCPGTSDRSEVFAMHAKRMVKTGVFRGYRRQKRCECGPYGVRYVEPASAAS